MSIPQPSPTIAAPSSEAELELKARQSGNRLFVALAGASVMGMMATMMMGHVTSQPVATTAAAIVACATALPWLGSIATSGYYWYKGLKDEAKLMLNELASGDDTQAQALVDKWEQERKNSLVSNIGGTELLMAPFLVVPVSAFLASTGLTTATLIAAAVPVVVGYALAKKGCDNETRLDIKGVMAKRLQDRAQERQAVAEPEMVDSQGLTRSAPKM